MVGLGRLELPTSPLSGARSSHLSYRPFLWLTASPHSNIILPKHSTVAGGAGRDRTGDLLNANQALSQLSYSPRESGRPDHSRPPSLNSIEADWMQDDWHRA